MEPLRPVAATPNRNWFAQHAVGLATLVIGAAAFVAASLSTDAVWTFPDLRLTLPFFVAALVGTVVSLARREGLPVLPLAGLGLAGVALVMGWFLVMAVIVAVTAVVILIMTAVM